MILSNKLILLLCASMLMVHAGEAQQHQWLPISDGILEQLKIAEKKIGYPGASAGITVDPASGAVFVVICDQGLWKSTNHGESFQRVDNNTIGGRCETGFALDYDPAGQRLMCFMIYGSSALTTDGGKSFTPSTLSHLDFGAVDWSTEKVGTMISVKHESGDEGVLSHDGGQTWTSLGKGFKQVGIFPGGVLMAGKSTGLERSSDGGSSWTQVSDIKPRGLAMRIHHGIGYWTCEHGVMISTDLGKTWSVLGNKVDAYYGPYFSDNKSQLLVVGKDGVCETTDNGETWSVIAPLPREFKVGGPGPNFAWDAKANILYASSMGKPAWRFIR